MVIFMSYQNEVQEAIYAGKQALSALENAQDALNKANGWSFVDMLGMDFLGGFMKHSKMNQAKKYLQEAKRTLELFDRELADVSRQLEVNLDTADLLGFADYFFDGLFTDMLMQSRISKAQKKIDQAIIEVRRILTQLQQMY